MNGMLVFWGGLWRDPWRSLASSGTVEGSLAGLEASFRHRGDPRGTVDSPRGRLGSLAEMLGASFEILYELLGPPCELLWGSLARS